MFKTALITSFAPWRSHQRSNSSDDLLVELIQSRSTPASVYPVRQLPVNVPVAKDILITKIQQVQPDVVFCCGMAESRTKLNVESRAIVGNQILYTDVNLQNLVETLKFTEISNDAGRFVCNGLYYAILNYLNKTLPGKQCLFVHVPILTAENREAILSDFGLMLERVLAS